MSDIEETPSPIRAAREQVAAYDSRRGAPRGDPPIRISDAIKARRLIFDLPIAVHVTIWLFIGGGLVTTTTWFNHWMSDRTRYESDTSAAIEALSRRQDTTDMAIKEFQREVTPAIRSLTEQVSRLGGIIDSRNKINSTLRGTGGIGE